MSFYRAHVFIDRVRKLYERHTGERRYPVAEQEPVIVGWNWIPGQARNDEIYSISPPDK